MGKWRWGLVKAYIDVREVTIMEEATINLRDRLLVRLLFRLGCRISEALALKVGDVDFLVRVQSPASILRAVLGYPGPSAQCMLSG